MHIKLKAIAPLVLVIVAALSGFFWLRSSKVTQYKISADSNPSCQSMDIVLVMDLSSSMNPTEQTVMKSAMKNFVDLTPTSTFSVISFSQNANKDLGFYENTAPETVKTRIDEANLSTDGTNWHDALHEAKGSLAQDFRPNNPNLVIFASDNGPDYYSTYDQSGDIIIENVVYDPTGTTALTQAKTMADEIKASGTKIIGLSMLPGDIAKFQTLIGGAVYHPPGPPWVLESDVASVSFLAPDASIGSIGFTLNHLAQEICPSPQTPPEPEEGAASLSLSVSADPTGLPIGGGNVTFTYLATNPSSVDISNISVTDKACAPVNYIGGDKNGDAKLQNSEEWVFACSRNTTEALTSEATVSGLYNGAAVTATATTTVTIIPAGPPTTGRR